MAILNRCKYIIVSVLMIISILSINVIKPKAEIYDSINIINNGNFANGITGWYFVNSNGSVSEEILNFTSVQEDGRIFQISNNNYIIGHKYYVRGKIKTSSLTTDIVIKMNDGITSKDIYSSLSTDWQIMSDIFTWESSGSNRYIFIWNIGTLMDIVKVDYIMIIDLTDAYGAGNEPNILDCNNIYSEYFEGLKRQDIKPHDVTENAHKTVIQMIVSTMLVPIDMLKSYKVGNQISLFDIFIGMIILVILTKTILKIGGRTSSDIR